MGIEEVIIEMARREGKLEGKLEGKKEGKLEERNEQKCLFIENLLCSTDFSTQKIASLVGVTQAFVEEIKNKLRL